MQSILRIKRDASSLLDAQNALHDRRFLFPLYDEYN